MTDPLTRAVQASLWPALKSERFAKVTARKFARERNGVFQQLWVDANGVAGKKRTVVVLCANFPFADIRGYCDPHGFRISNGRSWPMDTEELAMASMRQIIAALQASELRRLDDVSSVETMLALLDRDPWTGWHVAFSDLHRRWMQREADVLAVESSNRAALKL